MDRLPEVAPATGSVASATIALTDLVAGMMVWDLPESPSRRNVLAELFMRTDNSFYARLLWRGRSGKTMTD